MGKPYVKDGELYDDREPSSFTLQSSYFKQWLENNKYFRYVSTKDRDRSYGIFKDSRGYWTAQKRVNGKLRAKRLGDSSSLAKMPLEFYADIAVFLLDGYQTKESKIDELELENQSLRCQNDELNGKVQNYQYLVDSLTEKLVSLEDALREKEREKEREKVDNDRKLEIIKLLEKAKKASNQGGVKTRLINQVISLLGS